MKKILLTGMLLLGMSVSLSADTFKNNKNACDAGGAVGCTRLGDMYLNGQGVKQDYFKAKESFGKACDGGNAGGM